METASAAECNSESSTLVVLTSNQDVKHVVIPNSSVGQSKKKHLEIYFVNDFSREIVDDRTSNEKSLMRDT